jgi:hypothetical protein
MGVVQHMYPYLIADHVRDEHGCEFRVFEVHRHPQVLFTDIHAESRCGGADQNSARVGPRAVQRRVDSSGCKPRPVTGRSNR